jgi:hypothetical protein
MSRDSKNVLTGNCRLLTKWLLSVMVDIEVDDKGIEQDTYLVKVTDVHHTFMTLCKNDKAVVSIVKKNGETYDFVMDNKTAAREFHLRLFSLLSV